MPRMKGPDRLKFMKCFDFAMTPWLAESEQEKFNKAFRRLDTIFRNVNHHPKEIGVIPAGEWSPAKLQEETELLFSEVTSVEEGDFEDFESEHDFGGVGWGMV